ncbi:MAG: hypothetical protein KDD56_04260 [Bdellovibrionales bacterium]|nr:hypothetical protein [Bdellovibrionales bacterium]
MARAFSPGLQCVAFTKVTKRRELPVAGETLVKVGDKVNPDTLVARAYLDGDLLIERVSETLGIEAYEVIKALKVKEGDSIKVGDLVCEHSGLWGLFKSRYYARAEGKVEFIAEKTGHIGIRAEAIPLEVKAYISGEVLSVEAGRAVEIQTTATFAQGIFGVGGEKKGEIYILDISPNKSPKTEDIPTDCSGKILIGGTRPSVEVLNLASKRGASAFVTGSIDDRTLTTYLGYDLGIALTGDEDLSMSLIVTEGFGDMPISERILNVVSSHQGRTAAVNGATQVRAGALRPEIIIPHQDRNISSDDALSELVLEVGAKVRIIRVPYFGQLGIISNLPNEPEQIETGAYTRVLYAKLENDEIIRVPRANVELV